MKSRKYWTIFVDISDPDAERIPCRVGSLEKIVAAEFIANAGFGPMFKPGRYRVSSWEVDDHDVPLSAAQTHFYTVKWTAYVEAEGEEVHTKGESADPKL